MPDALTLINGKPADCIPVADRGLQYGDGLFETMAVVNTRLPFWPYHYQRLLHGCARLQMPIPNLSELQTDLAQLLDIVPRAIIKLILTRGGGPRGYAPPLTTVPTRILQQFPWPDIPTTHTSEGVRVRRCQLELAQQPRLAGIKHLNRLEQVLARAEWNDPSIAEGLVGDANGHVIEAIAHNVFIVEAGCLMTPSLAQCGVAGVMREWILEQAPNWGIATQVLDISWQRLSRANEVFLCNSVHGIWPVRQFEAHRYTVGPVTKQISHAYEHRLLQA
jgi:4-amino-4-deoxychorismate lyase